MLPPNWKENDILVNGNMLHYTRTGDGKKPSLVLAHGFSDSGMCWLPAASALSADYDVILPDARGHGKSARVQPGEKIDMPADLAGLIEALGLKRPIIGGHSMGANVSSETAARFPGLARALILEDPAWWIRAKEPAQNDEQSIDPYAAWLLSLKDESVEEVMDKCRHDSPTWPEIELRPWAESKLAFDKNFLHILDGFGMGWEDVAKSIQCPTLLITADPSKGSIVTSQSADLAVGFNSRIRVAHIEGAGHNIRRENFTAFMAAVQGFLKETA